MAKEKIIIGIDNQVIELEGQQLEAFLAQKKLDQAEEAKAQKLIEAQESKIIALRESAKEKLAALGLTEDEVKVLIGIPLTDSRSATPASLQAPKTEEE